MRAKRSAARVEILDQQREAPEARRVIARRRRARSTSCGSWISSRISPPEAEERLARRARGRRLLAHAAQIEAGRLQRRDAAVEVAARPPRRGRSRARRWDAPARVRQRALGERRRQPVELRAVSVAQRPAGDARDGSALRGRAARQLPPRAHRLRRRRARPRGLGKRSARCRSGCSDRRRRSPAPPSGRARRRASSSSIVGAGMASDLGGASRPRAGSGRSGTLKRSGVNGTPELSDRRRTPDPRDLLHEPADRGDGQHDRQRRAAVDPPRSARVAFGLAVDDRRVRDRDRQPAAAVRLDRRPPRAQAHLPGRAC